MAARRTRRLQALLRRGRPAREADDAGAGPRAETPARARHLRVDADRRPVANRGRPARSSWSRTSVKAPVAVKTAGADSPCTSACSQANQPPGFSSRPAVAATTRIASRPSSPDHRASAGSWSRTSAVDRLPGSQRDVRRVGDDRVHLAVQFAAGNRRCPLRAGSTPVPARLRRAQAHASGDFSTACTTLPGTLGRDRTGDRARPGAQVHDERRLDAGEPFEDPADHHLGLRAGHEHPRPDGQLAVPEGRRTGEVLQRLAGRPPRHQFSSYAAPARPSVTSACRRLDPSDVGEQLGGVVVGRGDPGLAPAGRSPRRSRPLSVAPAESTVLRGGPPRSASVSAWITGARSPSRTWSRLCAL